MTSDIDGGAEDTGEGRPTSPLQPLAPEASNPDGRSAPPVGPPPTRGTEAPPPPPLPSDMPRPRTVAPPRPQAAPRDLTPFTYGLTAAMALSVLLAFGLAAALFARASTVSSFDFSLSDIESADDRVVLWGGLYIVGYILGLIALMTWLFVGSRNIERCGQYLERKPGLAWLCWIPIVHWILTPMMLNQVSRRSTRLLADSGSRGVTEGRNGLLMATYGIYTFAQLASGVGRSSRDSFDLDSFASADRAGAFGVLVGTVATGFLLAAVWRISSDQSRFLQGTT